MNENNEFELEGYWWLPENENNRVLGILKYNQFKGVDLEVYGPLEKVNQLEYKANDENKKDTIYGISFNGEKVTIRNCIKIEKIITDKFIKETYRGLELFIGNAHIYKEFYPIKIYVDFNLLNSWISRENPYSIKTTLDKRNLRKFEFIYNLPDHKSFKFNFNNLYINFGFKFEYQICEEIFGKFYSREKVYFFIEVKDQVDFVEYNRIINIFQSFLTFATSDIVIPQKMYVYLSDNQLLEYYSTFTINISFLEYKLRENMLLPYHEIEKNFIDIFNKWVELYDLLDLNFLNSLYLKILNPIYMFISLVPRIETFFINKYPEKNEIIEKDKYIILREKIIKIIENFYKNYNLNFKKDKDIWINKIESLNIITLKRILKLIMKNLEMILYNLQLFKNKNEIKEFINDVIYSRNYYIHLNKKYKNKAKKGGELYLIAKKIHYILIILILKEFNYDDKEIINKIKRIKYI